jgi:hypothetical protein
MARQLFNQLSAAETVAQLALAGVAVTVPPPFTVTHESS